MASSGSYDYSLNAGAVCLAAYQQMGIVAEGASLNSAQSTEAMILLNMIVKLRSSFGMPSWAIKRGYVLPFTGASSINTNSHVVTSYTQTTLSADAASTDTTIDVTSATGFADTYAIGIELDDSTMQWTTESGAPSSTTITLSDALTGAASSGNYVYVYNTSSRVQKPQRIIQANIMDISSDTSWVIKLDTRDEYYSLSDRTTSGVPNQFFYDYAPSSDTALETNGTIYVFPRFPSGQYLIEFSYVRPFQDLDATSDTFDFPQAFYLPLTLELASVAGSRYGMPITERAALKKEAKDYMEEALETVYEEGSTYLEPDMTHGGK